LKPDEAAIEYVNFYYQAQNTDDSIYAVFVITQESEYPEFIKLCSYSEINKYLSGNKDEENYIKIPGYCNAIYNLIFSPLEKILVDKKNIYISPSGILNRVSFASLQSNDKKYLIDKYKIEYCNNITEIVSRNDLEKETIKNAAIFGGIKYDLDSISFMDASKRTRGNISNKDEIKPDLNEFIPFSSQRGGGCSYLPGTLTETQSITEIIKNNGIDVLSFIGGDGTEEAFKSLSGVNSPSILHIATHGFYFPQINKNQENEKTFSSQRSRYKSNTNPLFRSGIVLAGVNLLWKEDKKFEGTEDGILTSYEVTSMDLLNTELVVLSACETGLGDIKNSEGVFGLQRSFKIAGAKHIIMSLWKVIDKETAELMQTFYKKWIQDKMPIQDAFNETLRDMRDKYNEPYYWSAFILI
jgi:CHAT domain-containing protein